MSFHHNCSFSQNNEEKLNPRVCITALHYRICRLMTCHWFKTILSSLARWFYNQSLQPVRHCAQITYITAVFMTDGKIRPLDRQGGLVKRQQLMQALYETTVVEAELSRKANLSICSPSSTVWSFGQWAAERMSSLIKVSEISSLHELTGINLDIPHLLSIPGLYLHHRLTLFTKPSVYNLQKETLHVSFLLQLVHCCIWKRD